MYAEWHSYFSCCSDIPQPDILSPLIYRSTSPILSASSLRSCFLLICREFIVFSERELTRSRSLYAIACPSVCLSSVTFVHPTQPVEIFGIFLMHLIPWPSVDIHGKFYGDRPRGNSPLGGLNAKGVAKYSDFGVFGCHI